MQIIEKIIERLEEYRASSEDDYHGLGCEDDFGAMNAYGHAIEIVNQVAEEYGDSQTQDSKKIYDYIKRQINPYGKPFDGTVYAFGLQIMNYIERMRTEEHEEEVCEWREDMTLSRSAIGHGKFESLMYVCKWKYCPYCGKRIKVVE